MISTLMNLLSSRAVKNRMWIRLVLPIPFAYALSGCSPGAGPQANLTGDPGLQGLAASCPGAQKVSPSDLALQGKSQAQISELVMASLNQDPACAGSDQVSWKASSAKVISSDSNRFVGQFSQPGRYLIEAKFSTTTTPVTTLSVSTTVVDNMPVLQGPQVGMVGLELTYAVVIPEGLPVTGIQWNFGDGSTQTQVEDFAAPVTHRYVLPGSRLLTASVQLENGAAYELSQNVLVLDYYDNFDCVKDAEIFAPQIADMKTPVDFHARLPACILPSVSAIRWTFGDQSNQDAGLSVQHVFEKAGVYSVVAEVYSPLSDNGVLFRLTHSIRIQEPVVQEPPPKCPILGESKTEYRDEAKSQEACGLDGHRDIVRHTRVVSECQVHDLIQDWVEVSRESLIKEQGECQGQSCSLPAGGKISDGSAQVFYSSSAPQGACADVQLSRRCENGTLSGDSSYNQVQCQSGCVGFGVHGTKRNSVVVGEEREALVCRFGETGFFDLFDQVVDQVCQNGQIQTTSSRRGSLKEKGTCPVYHWEATSEWTACTADCGGKQTQIQACRDQKGASVAPERCDGTAPVVEQACDGHPEAVRREEVAVTEESANSSAQCPKNQIGLILKSRSVTTTRVYACLNHQVALESQATAAGEWKTETYCRDYVAYRCSHDSLSNSDARGRYRWMTKCQDQVPAIKEFLTRFSDVTNKQGQGIDSGSRFLYPTFMNAGVKPEKPWIAPKTEKASCDVPAKVYVSAVCVSSCATPDQMIATELRNERLVKSQSFIEALTAKTAHVVTLQEGSTLERPRLQKTAVSSWVTELVDGEHEILVLKMRSGGELRVTPNHPLLAASGEMREARTFKSGEFLVKVGGVRDEIRSIQSTIHQGKVYNLFTTDSALLRNIVVTNGYLNGTAFYQNEGSQNLNRQILRSRLMRGIFE